MFGIANMITGINFIERDLWSSGQFGLDQVKGMAAVLVVAYVIFTIMFSCLGIFIVTRRSCSVAWLAIYAVLLFFVVIVPLIAEGAALTKLDKIDNEEIQEYCNKDMGQIHKEQNRMVYVFFDFAHRFDMMSDHMLDTYMCTEKCPCLDYGENPSTK